MGQPLQGDVYPFKTIFNYVQGSVPNFRLGTLTVNDASITIAGKAVTRYEIQVPVLIACLFLRLGFLIAYFVMEYGVRKDELISVGWEQVRQVVTNARKQRLCLVYEAPNYKGVVKTFSLTTKMESPQYEAFLAAAQKRLPGRVAEGKLRAWTSPPVWVFCAGALIGLVFVGILMLTDSLKGSH